MAAATTIAPTLDAAAVAEFAGTLRGAVIRPDDPTYDEAAAVRNGLIDRHPALIARCSGVADVVAAVNFAREHDLLLSVRGGGHNVAGTATNDGGLVIDLSAMRGVRVDPAARTVRVQGGATWGDVDRETQLFGLATPGGVVSTHRRRRAHPARRLGLAAPQVRLLRRQPPLGRDRHRRRPGAHRQRDREPGPVLGGARGGQQLRGRHLVRVPAAPGRAAGGPGRAVLRAGGRRTGAPGLARLHGHRAGRGQLQCALLEHPGRRGLSRRSCTAGRC